MYIIKGLYNTDQVSLLLMLLLGMFVAIRVLMWLVCCKLVMKPDLAHLDITPISRFH